MNSLGAHSRNFVSSNTCTYGKAHTSGVSVSHRPRSVTSVQTSTDPSPLPALPLAPTSSCGVSGHPMSVRQVRLVCSALCERVAHVVLRADLRSH